MQRKAQQLTPKIQREWCIFLRHSTRTCIRCKLFGFASVELRGYGQRAREGNRKGVAMTEEDNKAQKCLSCGAVMFGNVQVDAAGHVAADTLMLSKLHLDESEIYFKCPQCGAKNVVEMETSASEVPQLKFSHVMP
jgi:predicted nucleic-acid-binding Zn-ribbon protein